MGGQCYPPDKSLKKNHWIVWFVLSTLIHWVVIYPLDCIIHPFNNGPWTADQVVSRAQALARDMGCALLSLGYWQIIVVTWQILKVGGWAGAWGGNHPVSDSTANDVLSI